MVPKRYIFKKKRLVFLMPEPGDKVEIKTNQDIFLGTLMPSIKEEVLVIKLESGYNLGINKHKIKQVNLLSKKEIKEVKKAKIIPKKGLKKVTILHTGGTIASKVSYETGGTISRFTPEELLELYPTIKELVNIDSKLISNIFSEDMRFGHYNLMAKAIALELEKGAEGIIITHGTDTLHYTAAALSFILENLSIPVLLVGSQRSSDRGSSDARLNLEAACQFIAQTDFIGVAICMHETTSDSSCVILPGLKTRKMHSSKRDAFKSINMGPIARIQDSKIHVIAPFKRPSSKKLIVKPIKEGLKIGILKVHPNLLVEELRAYNKFDGLILEGTGLGHLPINSFDKITEYNKKILNELKRLTAKIPVIVTTQTIYGRINMNVYSTGRILQEVGVMGNLLDMTSETAFIKLAWVLSNYPKEVREKFHENLRGEINTRLLE